MKSRTGNDVWLYPRLSPWYTVLKRPPSCTPELGAAARTSPRNLPSPLVPVARAMLKLRDASCRFTQLAQPSFLSGYLDKGAVTFPCGLPVNATPPPLLLQATLPGFCPKQRTHGPQGFALLARALFVANSTWTRIQTVATRPGPPGPRRLRNGALGPSPPVKGSDHAVARPSTFITLGEALCLFKGDWGQILMIGAGSN